MADDARRCDAAPPLAEDLAARATVMAMGVRNAMEGIVHGGQVDELNLSDEQMATLNPIVRNAIATALHAEKQYLTERAARAYLDFQAQLVPSHWEPAELLKDYTPTFGRSTPLGTRRLSRSAGAVAGRSSTLGWTITTAGPT